MEDQAIVPDITTSPVEETKPEEVIVPTKSVKNFWERLDEVFAMNLESAKMREQVEDLLEQFEDSQLLRKQERSFLFQPERMVISSNDDIIPSTAISERAAWPFPNTTRKSSYFNSFRVKLKRALVGVKSIQMLSAVIPNAVQNIPDNSTYFFYYRVRTVNDSQVGEWNNATLYNVGDIVAIGFDNYVCKTPLINVNPQDEPYWFSLGSPAVYNNIPLGSYPLWDNTIAYNTNDVVNYQGVLYLCQEPTVPNLKPGVQYWVPVTLPINAADRPNYYELGGIDALKYVYLTPSTILPEWFQAPNNNPLAFNRTFATYQDLLNSINYCATQQFNVGDDVNDITFQFSDILNRFIFQPLKIFDEEDNLQYYYIPAGYEDPNIARVLSLIVPNTSYDVEWAAQYTLNLRMGFTWNGLFPSPWSQDPLRTNDLANAVFNYIRPMDPIFTAAPYNLDPWGTNVVTANNYGDLVNTSCVRVYTDVTLGSTQDTNNVSFTDAEGLLSIVPVNTNNLGVGFYQNNFNNELTKIPNIITEIGIRLVNDQGLPFWLPSSATCLIELSFTYK